MKEVKEVPTEGEKTGENNNVVAEVKQEVKEEIKTETAEPQPQTVIENE